VAGWELAKGAGIGVVNAPPTPLQPMMSELPDLSPGAEASLVSLSMLSSGTTGVSSLRLKETASDGSRVLIRAGGYSGAGEQSVETLVPVSVLAAGLKARAWCEYPGSVDSGHIPELLSDGRTCWTVREAAGLRRHAPSAFVELDYHLDLGAPVLRFAGTEISNGGSLLLTRSQLGLIAKGGLDLSVEWPEATLLALGQDAKEILSGFETSLVGLSTQDSSIGSLCGDDGLPSWGAENELRSDPRIPPACRAETGIWSLRRSVEGLGEPEIVSSQEETIHSEGTYQFQAPEQQDGVRRGRLSARGGALVSSSSSLELEFLP